MFDGSIAEVAVKLLIYAILVGAFLRWQKFTI